MDRFVSDKASLVRELLTKIEELEESAFYINHQLEDAREIAHLLKAQEESSKSNISGHDNTNDNTKSRFVSDTASLVRELISKIDELEESASYINTELDGAREIARLLEAQEESSNNNQSRHDNTNDNSKSQHQKNINMADDNNSNERQDWIPLLSDPSILNVLLAEIGFDTSLYKLTDVVSTEPWGLDMIPKPVASVIMLYPKMTENHLEHHGGQNISQESDDVWFMKERNDGNACGTYAILHSLMNLPLLLRAVAIRQDSWLHSFSKECPLSLSPVVKSERLECDSRIKRLHNKAAAQEDKKQATVGNVAEKVITHYVAFVHVNGGLYELDGHKEGPIRHCDTKQETFLKDTCEVVKKLMTRDPHEHGFSILALASQNTPVARHQEEHPQKRRKQEDKH
jgi:ubiquitin carboxyl-terminal hydrolase L3